MLLLGIDLGTSSVKIAVVDATSQECIASATFPETEAEIISLQPGWAEQSPNRWWEHVQKAILKCNATNFYNPADIGAIGIAYQMHGLVMVNKQQQILRNSIIWCDSRAVSIGNTALEAIGKEKCLSELLNSPGNFTASKLAWVKANEPAVYDKADKILLPGDFIAMKLTGQLGTTPSALSEGIFWDFKKNAVSEEIKKYYGFSDTLFPDTHPVFSIHGLLQENVAAFLSLKKGIPVSYKAGDQPNNALSLNVLQPGEVAATAGTSGVIYSVSDQLQYDAQSRINGFAHVNHLPNTTRIGNLLCINGAGIFNRWIKRIVGGNHSYTQLNEMATDVAIGSNGLQAYPFGNGAERMLGNRSMGACFSRLNFNVHNEACLIRCVQEGIAFAFRYGLDIMRENGMQPQVIRAGNANMFLSNVFTQSFAGTTNCIVQLYECDGSVGAAIGAGLGSGVFASEKEAFRKQQLLKQVTPQQTDQYEQLYQDWKKELMKQLSIIN